MLKRLFSSQLRINMVSGVAVTVLNSMVLAVAYPIYLHFLGYEQYGVWLVLSTVLTFARLGNLGVSHAVMKLVAEEHGRSNWEAAQQYVATAMAMLAISGGAVLVLIVLLRTQIVALFKLSQENAETVLWLLPYVGTLSVYVLVVQALNATLSGLGRMDLANYVQALGRIAAVVVASLLLYRGRGVESLLVGNCVSYVLIHCGSVIFIRGMAPVRLLRLKNLKRERSKRLIGFGSGVFGGSLIMVIFHPANKILLSRYVGVAAIPVYEIGFNASMQIRALLEAGLRALLPEVSRIGAEVTEHARNRIAHINRRAIRLILVLGVPMYALIMLFSGPLLRVWLGRDLPAALPGFFRVMLVASLVGVIGVPAYYTLMGLGRVYRCFATYAISLSVHFMVVAVVALSAGHLVVQHLAYGTLAGICAATGFLLWEFQRSRKAMKALFFLAESVSEPTRGSVV